jgi:anti-sigma B factor antagonist
VDVADSDRGVTVALRGDLDLVTAPGFNTVIASIDGRTPGQEMTLDLSRVGFCDSVGISALVAVRQHCDSHRWLLQTVGAQPAVRRMLVDYTGLGEFLNVRDPIDDEPG